METHGNRQRRFLARLLLGTTVGVLAVLPTGAVDAACAAPTITANPNSGAPGSSFVVTGQGFADACNDVIENGEAPPPAPPTKGVVITFQQQGRSWRLGTVDADASYSFSFQTAVPLDARTGEASVVTSQDSDAFTVSPARPATPIRRKPKVTG
jgi:hypothetical protein